MALGISTKRLRIGGMTCVSCQNKIEKKLLSTAGVISAKVSYGAGTADITYDTDIICLKDIGAIIGKLGYEALGEAGQHRRGAGRAAGLLIIIVSLYMLLQQLGILNLPAPGRLAEGNMGYGMLFVIGLFTSVHCLAMCGGINLSQCIPSCKDVRGQSSGTAALRPSLLYNLGRVVSYTAVGFIVGALGSAITFTGAMQGALKLIAGVFMVIMGVNMLGIFPWLRKIAPRMPRLFAGRASEDKAGGKSPLIVGLLNGLMPCGPLQAMQIYALSTGNPFEGALSMLFFSLGTVPLMFGLGALSSALGRKFTHKTMTVGAVLVAVLGLSMFSQGWSLSGLSPPDLLPNGVAAGAGDSGVRMEDGVQIVESVLSSGRYPDITVQAGIPVKWVIDAPEGSINGCNNRILIREYDIEYPFQTGENVIEFTPTEAGRFQYSCWMGMIRGSITVTEAGASGGASDASGDGGEAYGPGTDGSASPPAGGCCAAGSFPDFADGKIPTDNIQVAALADGVQTATVRVDGYGYSPAVIVIERGAEFTIAFDPAELNACNFLIYFPAYGGGLDLTEHSVTPKLTAEGDFTFECPMGMLHGYVKVVDDLDNVDLESVKRDVGSFVPSGGAGCCN